MPLGLHDAKAGQPLSANAKGLDAVHLVLWQLAQHVAYQVRDETKKIPPKPSS